MLGRHKSSVCRRLALLTGSTAAFAATAVGQRGRWRGPLHIVRRRWFGRVPGSLAGFGQLLFEFTNPLLLLPRFLLQFGITLLQSRVTLRQPRQPRQADLGARPATPPPRGVPSHAAERQWLCRCRFLRFVDAASAMVAKHYHSPAISPKIILQSGNGYDRSHRPNKLLSSCCYIQTSPGQQMGLSCYAQPTTTRIGRQMADFWPKANPHL